MMTDQDLYERVEKRIDQRNRRRLFWAIDLGGLILSLAVLIASSDRPYDDLAAAVFMGWMGIFAVHSILLWMAETRQSDIENEVAKLRQAVYEKPKRLELSDEGELMDTADLDLEDERRHRNLTT